MLTDKASFKQKKKSSHGCLKRLFIDFFDKNVILYFTKLWKPSANNQIC